MGLSYGCLGVKKNRHTLSHRTVPLLCATVACWHERRLAGELARLPTAIPGRGAVSCRGKHPEHLARRTGLPPPKCVEVLLKIHGHVGDRCGGLSENVGAHARRTDQSHRLEAYAPRDHQSPAISLIRLSISKRSRSGQSSEAAALPKLLLRICARRLLACSARLRGCRDAIC